MTLNSTSAVTPFRYTMNNDTFQKSPLAPLVLFISSIGWGLTWLPLKALGEMGIGGMPLIFIAFMSGTLLLAPWFYRQYPLWKKSIGLILMIALAGGIANAAFQTAIYYGEVKRVIILFYMLPVWSVIGGRIFLQEKIDAIRIMTIALCIAGAFTLLDIWHTSWQSLTWIDALALTSGMALAATNILFRYTQDIPASSKVFSMFAGGSVLIGLGLVMFPTTTTLPEINVLAMAVIYGAFWLTLITFGTQWGVTRMEAGRSAVIIATELVVAVVSSALILGVALLSYEIIGGVMVFCAALLESTRKQAPDKIIPLNY